MFIFIDVLILLFKLFGVVFDAIYDLIAWCWKKSR